MPVAPSYPGVYIDEFAPGAPIQGTATNIAAFLGPLAQGEIIRDKKKKPALVTNWDDFQKQFGSRPAPGFFTWYAVRGFFENGGTNCYIIRVSNADYARAVLANVDQVALANIRALEPGQIDTPIQVNVIQPSDPQLPPGATLFGAAVTGTLNGSQISIPSTDPGSGPPTDARAFRVGDWVVISLNGQTLGKPTRVKTVTADALVIDEKPAPGTTPTVQVKLVYLPGGDIRVVADPSTPPAALAIGTTVQLALPGGTNTQVVDAVKSELLTPQGFKTYRLTLRDGLRTQVDPTNTVAVTTLTFHVEISQTGQGLRFTHLAPDPASDRYYIDEINRAGNLVYIEEVEPQPTATADKLVPAFVPVSVAGGANETLDTLTDKNFTDALDTLRRVSDARLVSIPDGYVRQKPTLSIAVQSALIAHCEQMGDRFAVLDSQPGLEPFGDQSVETQRDGLDSSRGYGALYYPWIRVSSASGIGPPLLVPPSGHVCGLMARVDDSRGVFKAPANEIVKGAIAVERLLSDDEHGLLNLHGINVIRVFKDGGTPYLYGARTNTTDSNWQYVNVRRLFLYMEKSIQEGIRWAVFEPNNMELWGKLKQTISDFLLTIWRAGGLFGAAPKNAYYVRIDEVLNPFSEQQLGRLHIEIGARPTIPAEFIIVRIGIWDGGASVTEG